MIISLTERILTLNEAILIGAILIIGTIAIVRIVFPREITKVIIDDFICERYPEETISKLPINAVSTMTDIYKNKQLAAIKNCSKLKEDAQVIWFDLKTLKTFLYHVENETIKKDSTISNEQLGINIYYGSYSNKEYNQGTIGLPVELSGKYAGKHTLVMIPTITKEGKRYDYNPVDKSTYTSGFTKRHSQGDIIALGGPESINRNSSNTTARNHGGLFPPGNPEAEEYYFIN